MSEQPKLSDEDRENLVAYLDGELDDEAAHALEAKLSLDPDARADAESLRQAWELLDYLPRAEATASFTHRTVERLAVVQSQATATAVRRRWQPWLIGAGWAAAVMLAFAGGHFAVRMAGSTGSPSEAARSKQEQEEMSRDLRVLDNLPYYQYVDDIEFLRSLDQPDLFGDDSGSR